ncbi:MAG: SPFH domain-containing protein [Gemmatimonadetes bacterium]|nr:SPFH domain-containing protein [Gemmatimonadota bacterium]
MFRESNYRATGGFPALFLFLAVGLGAFAVIVRVAQSGAYPPAVAITAAIVIALTVIGLSGLFVVNPGEAKVLVLFGDYKGTVKTAGFWWANPFLTKRSISLRVRNFETQKLKVNDSHANPIEIAAIVVWKVVETAEALFEVDDYVKYVQVQSESAVRTVAQSRPYDSHTEGEEALSTHTDIVAHALAEAMTARLSRAGVEVIEVRISHLAYSPEIAQAMLQRQQATAIIAARFKIVEGAVGMVENALEMLSKKGIVTLDEERKAQMVSNLLVVLCSERAASPVVNAGSIFG